MEVSRMDKRTARREFRKLANSLKFKKKTNGNKSALISTMCQAYTINELAKFIIKTGMVSQLAKARL